MFKKLSNENVITLEELRDFFNNDCFALPKDTPVHLCTQKGDGTVVECREVLADDVSIELFDI